MHARYGVTLWRNRHYNVHVPRQVDVLTGPISCIFGGCITRFLGLDHAAFLPPDGVLRWTPIWVILVGYSAVFSLGGSGSMQHTQLVQKAAHGLVIFCTAWVI